MHTGDLHHTREAARSRLGFLGHQLLCAAIAVFFLYLAHHCDQDGYPIPALIYAAMALAASFIAGIGAGGEG